MRAWDNIKDQYFFLRQYYSLYAYTFVKIVNVSLDRATTSTDALFNLFLRFHELVAQIVIDVLGFGSFENTFGAEEVFNYAVQIALTTAELWIINK